MKLVEKATAKLISDITNGSEFGWPPVCSGVFYQPERPTVSMADHCKDDTDSKDSND